MQATSTAGEGVRPRRGWPARYSASVSGLPDVSTARPVDRTSTACRQTYAAGTLISCGRPARGSMSPACCVRMLYDRDGRHSLGRCCGKRRRGALTVRSFAVPEQHRGLVPREFSALGVDVPRSVVRTAGRRGMCGLGRNVLPPCTGPCDERYRNRARRLPKDRSRGGR